MTPEPRTEDHRRVEADGVTMYVDAVGEGEPLVLLHGGMASNLGWLAQIDDFSARFRVIAPERPGHGHAPDIDGPYRYEAMAEATAALLVALALPPAHLVGWSDGGIIALLMAIHHPETVAKVVVFGANSASTGYVPGGTDTLTEAPADGELVAGFRALYDPVSPDGPDHFPVVWEKVRALWSEPFDFTPELASIEAPTLVMVADDDLVTIEHATEMYRTLPRGELAVLPGVSHAAPLERPSLFNRLVLDFLSDPPTTLLMPQRRAPG
ncbi:MAG TPA: alpha/beta hydrolase [Acidimicrobiales bacterium]|nr:alpha/beta hydrolase [Acidimicrobiales bacterium]